MIGLRVNHVKNFILKFQLHMTSACKYMRDMRKFVFQRHWVRVAMHIGSHVFHCFLKSVTQLISARKKVFKTMLAIRLSAVRH